MTAQEKLENVKTVADFLQDALALKDNNIVKDIVKAIGQATPWAKYVMESAGDALPIVAFFLKYAQRVMQEKDPNKQGYNACTLAYNRAVEEVFLSRSMQLQELKINPSQGVSILSKKNPNEIDMLGFKLDTALSHNFVIYADEVFRKFTEIIDLKQDLTNQLLKSIHQSFLRNLRLLLVHRDTKKEFADFKDLMESDDSQYQRQRILHSHLLYQSWLFNEAKVFRTEPFSLSDIYIEPECGVLKWSEIKENNDNQGSEVSGEKKQQKQKNPFSEKDSQRENLLSKVIEYIGDTDFNEPIVIQGIAGAGKSSFTLRLVNELINKGCTPIRILFKDLNLKDDLKIAVPYALQFGEKGFNGYKWKPTFDDNWFSQLISPQNNEKMEFGDKKTEISPYVFIFDGWDEISTTETQGFEDSIDKVLEEIRDNLIKKRRDFPPMRVIVTGRPTVDVTDTKRDTKLLTDKTPILTIRPLRPEQLETYIDKFQKARQAPPLTIINNRSQDNPIVPNQTINPNLFNRVLEVYRKDFQQLVNAHEQGNVEEIKGSMAVLGLPLLAYLSLRLMFKIQSEEELKDLIENPTNLYRALVDETCQGSGNPDFISELTKEKRFRLSGNKLRWLLWRTAEAITALGKESISREELKLRCKEEKLDKIVEEVTEDHVLSRLIISFFFKESVAQGCEFVHKSFREYLFAEGVVEIIKEYGRQGNVAQAYQKNTETGYKERKANRKWKEFEENDPRYELTHRLSKFFATRWLSPEIKDHLLNLLTWEIKRSYQMEKPYVSEQCTQPISVKQWGYIRDGLADVWDWWAEGVLLRPQPKSPTLGQKTEDSKPKFDPPYVQELAESCCPLDLEAWKPNLPTPVRVNTVDGRLGEAFFHLTAIVHGTLYHYQQKTVSSSNNIKPTQRKRYQTQQLVKDKNNKDCLLIQFAPSGEYSNFFRTLCHRINSSGWRIGWRSPRSFPSFVWAFSVNLSGADLSGANLRGAKLIEADLSGTNLSGAYVRKADLSGTNLSGADLSSAHLFATDLSKTNLSGTNLSRANLSEADLRKADLSGANLRKADLRKANLSGANLREADLMEADLSGTNLSGTNLYRANLSFTNLSGANLTKAELYRANLGSANLSRANFSGANLIKADFRGADLSGTKLSGADLSQAHFIAAKNLTVQQIKQAKNWELGRYDTEFSQDF